MTEKTDSGNLFIVASPSGGGKTTLARKLVSYLEKVEVSVSHTTRKKRPQEEHGRDYFFIQEKEFRTLLEADAFLEHAEVFGHYYGTSATTVKDRMAQGIDVLLVIDWQGARQIKTYFPQAITVFVVPPSLETLEERLLRRQQDDETIIAKRMEQAKEHLSHCVEFDYLIINDELDKAVQELSAIILANRLETSRQLQRNRKLLSFLLASQ